jgi:hypothetical protein
MTDINTNISNSISNEDLASIAAELGMDVSALKSPPRPQMRHGIGYKLRIVEAKDTVAERGASAGAAQVQLSVVALDEGNKPNKRTKTTIWAGYPLETESFKFQGYGKVSGAEQRENVFRDFSTLLKAKFPALALITRTSVGGKSVYLDASTGEAISGAAYENLVLQERIGLMRKAKAMLEGKDAKAFIGTEFYAVYDVWTNPETGKVNTKFIKYSPVALDGVHYESDASEMMAKAVATGDTDVDGSDLF